MDRVTTPATMFVSNAQLVSVKAVRTLVIADFTRAIRLSFIVFVSIGVSFPLSSPKRTMVRKAMTTNQVAGFGPAPFLLPENYFTLTLVLGLGLHFSIMVVMGLGSFFWSFPASYPSKIFTYLMVHDRWGFYAV